MTSTGPQRSLCLLFALLLAGVLAVVPGCNETESTTPTGSGNGDSASTGSNGENASNTGMTQDPASVDSEPLRTVLEFQQAILNLDLEEAQTLVDETSLAYQSVATAMQTLQALRENQSIPEEARELSRNAIRSAWVGATAEEAVNEGGSAIIAVTRSNGDIVDVNLTFFDGKWLIFGPDDLTQLR